MSTPHESAPTAERKVFGEHVIVKLPIDDLVRLPQVRSGLNPELPALKASIQENGLMNQIDVAHMDQSQLQEYIDFVNRTWKTQVNIDDYSSQIQADGSYYLVVAGHTRAEAIYQLQAEDPNGIKHDIMSKIHPVTRPQEIINLQINENIHSKPSQERRAMVIVEIYMYGIENGLWDSKAGFLRQSGKKFSRHLLDEAVGFSQLPPEARDFVFSGRLSYGAAVALGKATDTLIEYVGTKLGYDGALPEAAAEVFDQSYRQEVALLIAQILNRHLNAPAAKKFIEGQVQHKKDEMGRASGSQVQRTFLLVSAEEVSRAYRHQLTVELAKANRRMEELSIDSVVTVRSLQAQLLGEVANAEIEAECIKRYRAFGYPLVRGAVALAS